MIKESAKGEHHSGPKDATKGYVGSHATRAAGGDYSWQSNHKRYQGDYAWTASMPGPGTYAQAQAGRNLYGRMPGTPAYTPEGYGGPPIPGFSGGLLPVSASYEFLPQNTPVYTPHEVGQPSVQQPPVSPVQQLAPTYKQRETRTGQMDLGAAVKLKFFSSPEGMLYNGLVGDIVAIRMERGNNDFPEAVYDVRCPWRDPRTVKKEALDDKDHGHVLHSAFTADHAHENRRLLGNRPVDLPSMGGFAGQPLGDCPYIILTSIPREKLEPMREWKDAPQKPVQMPVQQPQMLPPVQQFASGGVSPSYGGVSTGYGTNTGYGSVNPGYGYGSMNSAGTGYGGSNIGYGGIGTVY